MFWKWIRGRRLPFYHGTSAPGRPDDTARKITQASVQIRDLEITYSVERRRVRHPRLEFKDGSLRAILPWTYPGEEALLQKHQRWIYKKSQFFSRIKQEAEQFPLSIERTQQDLESLILVFAERFEKSLGVHVQKIVLRRMTSRWGSCTSRGKITFNTLLGYVPERLVEYVVFHEVAHLRVRKHNAFFKTVLQNQFPDYRSREQELKHSWIKIQSSVLN